MLQMEGDYFPVNKLLNTVSPDLFLQGWHCVCVCVGMCGYAQGHYYWCVK